ncbi:MAG: O-antigen ligase family protein [Actinobacteria bacterium]|nr:O-antigen ligase family protein [Actinomycetota bacterium]
MTVRTGTPRSWEPQTAVAAFVGAVVIQLAVVFVGPSNLGMGILLAAVGMAVVLIGLASSVLAVLVLLLATFLRLALPVPFLPVDLYVLAFPWVLASAAIGIMRRVNRLPQLGAVEAAMVLYLVWNIGSVIVPHTYSATAPISGGEYNVWFFVVSGTMIPFVLYGVGRFVFDREPALRRLLWFVLGLATYSAAVSVMQFHGPTALVWPRFIVEDPNWNSRAVGVVNQPVENGLVLIIGFVVALHLAHQSPDRPYHKAGAYVVAATTVYAIYLTHTRVIWLAFGIVLIAGAVLARHLRLGFLTGLGTVVLAIGVGWSDFISADREAGGVASPGEVEDRLNSLATSIWAVQEKPLAGWGIGRFVTVNTYHHQQWSPDIEWIRGYGAASHFNEFGIAAELGLVGLGLWLAVLVLVFRRLVMAVRLLPQGTAGSGLAIFALLAFIVWLVAGATVDLRFLVFANALVMLLVGIAVGYADREGAVSDTADRTQGYRRRDAVPFSVPEQTVPSR